MGVSLRVIRRIIASCVFLWLVVLLPTLLQQEDSSSPRRWHDKARYHVPNGKVSRFPRQQPHEQRRSERRGRELRQPNHNNNNQGTNSIGGRNHFVDPRKGGMIATPLKQSSNPRQVGRKTPSRGGNRWYSLRSDGEPNDIEYNSSKRDLKLPLPIIVMGFPVSIFPEKVTRIKL
jgi:hypothetical protein